MKRRYRRFTAGIVLCAVLGMSAPPQALAGLVGTGAVAMPGARDRAAVALARAEVRSRLEAYGVDPGDLQQRLDALTDEEAAQLAERLDSLPAGGDGLIGALVLVFLVLLITDIVGLTKVFPFTRPVR